ncbi:MAG: GHKL domain-containing protein [Turicibacter sp.]|nr:GHKL domain-containing protein [Turicibacter sp.]
MFFIQLALLIAVIRILWREKFHFWEYGLLVTTGAISAYFLFGFIGIFAFVPLAFLYMCFLYLKGSVFSTAILVPLQSVVILLLGHFVTEAILAHIFGAVVWDTMSLGVFLHGFLALWLAHFSQWLFLHYQNEPLFDTPFTVLYPLFLLVVFSVFMLNILAGHQLGGANPLFSIFFLFFVGIAATVLFLINRFGKLLRKEGDVERTRLLYEQKLDYGDNLKSHAISTLEAYEEMRQFRHDYKNLLLSMSGFIHKEDLVGLKDWYLENIEPMGRELVAHPEQFQALNQIQVDVVRGLLISKLSHAQKSGLKTQFEATVAIQEFPMDLVDLCRGLGILLDNAIEASNHSLNVAFIRMEHSLLMVVQNSYSGELPTTEEMYQKGFSTKGENRGLGLAKLMEIVEATPNLRAYHEIGEGYFTQHLELMGSGNHA